MVLLSGARNTGGESRGGKGKGEVHPIGDGVGDSCLVKDAEQGAEGGDVDIPGHGGLLWRGTADPLPQLLAAIPNLEGRSARSNGDVDEECEEYDDFSDLPDTRSIASDDSFYPPDLETRGSWLHGEEDEEDDKSEGYDYDSFKSWGSTESLEPLTLFKACSSNNVIVLKALVRQGLSEEDVRETDRNNRTGLLVACYQGYVDIVIALSQCPHIDVNWQDNEGNTAIITATQAGADIYAVDPNRGYTSREWARFTGRYDTVFLMQKLLNKPSPEQISDQYKPEWPKMKELLAKAEEPKTCAQRISDCLRSAFTLNYFNEPEEDGVIDHMVRMTTSLSSPFVAVSCRTVCPGSPPCVGKCRYSVQEILRKQRAHETSVLDKNPTNSHEKLFQNTQVTYVHKKKERRASLQTSFAQRTNVINTRRTSLLPLNLLKRTSVRPGHVVPRVRISKAPTPIYYPERVKRRSTNENNNVLQIPKWRYKELKEQRKKAEDEGLRKAEEAEKQRQLQRSTIKKRTFT
ncbi:ankyrin repeat domain-containing protein 33B isoform X2 [Ascaphus truei]|uniref:ankyrin repeat domain-containing protein 33B isoform X2 n=1 Tax=Ascaphus truei TaxID=8439 RepID=UPI003F59DF27